MRLSHMYITYFSFIKAYYACSPNKAIRPLMPRVVSLICIFCTRHSRHQSLCTEDPALNNLLAQQNARVPEPTKYTGNCNGQCFSLYGLQVYKSEIKVGHG